MSQTAALDSRLDSPIARATARVLARVPPPSGRPFSVQTYFARVNWSGPVKTVQPAAPIPRSRQTKVSQYLAQVNWSGAPIMTTTTKRPSAAELLDLALLENVFDAHEANHQDVSIGDFSDFI
jgi:hypothetical protein